MNRHCDSCARSIGVRRIHLRTDDGRLLCTRCADGGQSAHHELWPECPVEWHDPYDHIALVGFVKVNP